MSDAEHDHDRASDFVALHPPFPRCPECDGGYGVYTEDREGHKAGDKVPHCDPWCSLQGAGRGEPWKHGDAR